MHSAGRNHQKVDYPPSPPLLIWDRKELTGLSHLTGRVQRLHDSAFASFAVILPFIEPYFPKETVLSDVR